MSSTSPPPSDDRLELFDSVVLLEDLPDERLRRGSIGAIVDVWDDRRGIFEVEFADRDGRPYAMIALRSDQLLKARWEPHDLEAAA